MEGPSISGFLSFRRMGPKGFKPLYLVGINEPNQVAISLGVVSFAWVP